MPTYKPNKKNTCSGFFADKEGESGMQYFHEHDGEKTVLLFASDYIQLPKEMRVLNENKMCWVRTGNNLPNTTDRGNIVVIPEMEVDINSLHGCSISQEIKETDKGKYIRKINSVSRKAELYIPDEYAIIIQKAMAENKDIELFVDQGKRAKIWLIGESDKIYACLPEYVKEQLEIQVDKMPDNPKFEPEDESTEL